MKYETKLRIKIALLAASWFALNCYAAERAHAAVNFYGDGNLLTNDIGLIPYGKTGFFDYVASDPGGSILGDGSVIDPLFNDHDQRIGSVYVPHVDLINRTLGSFYFYPEVFNHPVVDQVYVSNIDLYLDPASPARGAPATPETSTWLMVFFGLLLMTWKYSRSTLKPISIKTTR